MEAGGGLVGWLFGRRTYEGLLAYWNAQGGPFKEALNSSPKYVVSTTLIEPLNWPNSTLMRGDVAEAVGALKEQSEGVLAIMGSGDLIGSLMAAGLVDEYLLMIHPLVLGAGRRLFPENVEVTLRLTNSGASGRRLSTLAAGRLCARLVPAAHVAAARTDHARMPARPRLGRRPLRGARAASAPPLSNETPRPSTAFE